MFVYCFEEYSSPPDQSHCVHHIYGIGSEYLFPATVLQIATSDLGAFRRLVPTLASVSDNTKTSGVYQQNKHGRWGYSEAVGLYSAAEDKSWSEGRWTVGSAAERGIPGSDKGWPAGGVLPFWYCYYCVVHLYLVYHMIKVGLLAVTYAECRDLAEGTKNLPDLFWCTLEADISKIWLWSLFTKSGQWNLNFVI